MFINDETGITAKKANDFAKELGFTVEIIQASKVRSDGIETWESDIGVAVIRETATGKTVAAAQAWQSDDGDSVVPEWWMEAVIARAVMHREMLAKDPKADAAAA